MEVSSGDDSIGSDLGVADAEEEKVDLEFDYTKRNFYC